MNAPEIREIKLACDVILAVYEVAQEWINSGYINEEDAKSAVIATIQKALEIEVKAQGLSLARLMQEIGRE